MKIKLNDDKSSKTIKTFRKCKHTCFKACNYAIVFADTVELVESDKKLQLHFVLRDRFDKQYKLHFDLFRVVTELFFEPVPGPDASQDYAELHTKLEQNGPRAYTNFVKKVQRVMSVYISENRDLHPDLAELEVLQWN